jgi:hypothetical protein
MAGVNNIPTGLLVPTQIPLHAKGYSLKEDVLADLGINDNLAYTYEQGLIVYCVEEQTRWEWREYVPGKDDGLGLVLTNFTYPNGIVNFDIDYSNREFNFYKAPMLYEEEVQDLIDAIPPPAPGAPGTPGSVWRDGSGVPSNGLGINGDYYLNRAVGAGNGDVYLKTAGTYSVVGNIKGTPGTNGTNGVSIVSDGTTTIVTGTGTLLDPYIVEVKDEFKPQPGDTKEISISALQLTADFDGTGLGLNGRTGWAIMNGNNGTPNDNGKVVVAYGTNYSVLEATGGSKDAVVVDHNHPYSKMIVTTVGDQSVPGGATPYYTPTSDVTTSTGVSGTNKNMQPYVVRLRIMKI